MTLQKLTSERNVKRAVVVMKKCVFLIFLFNVVVTFSFISWWGSLPSQPILKYTPEETITPITTITPRRHLPPIAETGKERQCVEDFLTKYEQTCLKTMRPNPDNIVIDANRIALLDALKDATNGDAWMSDKVDKMLCPCVPSGLGKLTATDAMTRQATALQVAFKNVQISCIVVANLSE
jgi:hypothetical protein